MHKNSAAGLKTVVEELKSQVLGGDEFDNEEDQEEKDTILD